jgi:hypothetical protein
MSLPLLEGSYSLGVDVAHHDLSHYIDRREQAISFGVKSEPTAKGLVNIPIDYSIKKI